MKRYTLKGLDSFYGKRLGNYWMERRPEGEWFILTEKGEELSCPVAQYATFDKNVETGDFVETNAKSPGGNVDENVYLHTV